MSLAPPDAALAFARARCQRMLDAFTEGGAFGAQNATKLRLGDVVLSGVHFDPATGENVPSRGARCSASIESEIEQDMSPSTCALSDSD